MFEVLALLGYFHKLLFLYECLVIELLYLL